MYVCLCAQITLQNEKVKTISTVKYLHMKVVNGRENDNKVSKSNIWQKLCLNHKCNNKISSVIKMCKPGQYPLFQELIRTKSVLINKNSVIYSGM